MVRISAPCQHEIECGYSPYCIQAKRRTRAPRSDSAGVRGSCCRKETHAYRLGKGRVLANRCAASGLGRDRGGRCLRANRFSFVQAGTGHHSRTTYARCRLRSLFAKRSGCVAPNRCGDGNGYGRWHFSPWEIWAGFPWRSWPGRLGEYHQQERCHLQCGRKEKMTSVGQLAGHNIVNRKAKFTVERGGVLVLLHPIFLKSVSAAMLRSAFGGNR